MQKTVTFEKGITRVPYGDAVGDGELAKAHNVEVHGGSLRPAILKGSEVKLDTGMKLLYKHETGEYEHWILKNGTTLLWVDMGALTSEGQIQNGDTHTINEASWEKGMEFTNTGNVLVIMATGKKIRYVYWNENQYKWLGELPELEIECSTYSKHAGVYRHSISVGSLKTATYQPHLDIIAMYGNGENFDLEDMECVDKEGDAEPQSIHYPYQKDDTTHNLIVGAWADVIAKAASHNTFLFPYFLRYAIRLFDDTIAWTSAPILMQPTNGAPVCWNHRASGRACVNGEDNEKEWICFMVATNDESFIDDNADISENKAETNLNLKVLTDVNLTEWKDVIKSVDVYVSKPLTLFDVEGYYRTMKRPNIVFKHPKIGNDINPTEDLDKYYASWLFDQFQGHSFTFDKYEDKEVKPAQDATENENDLWPDDERTVIKSKWFEEQYRCDHISDDVFKHTNAEPLSYMRSNNLQPFGGDNTVSGVFQSELEWMHALAHSHEGYTLENGELKEGEEEERRKKLYFGLKYMSLIKPNGLEAEDVKDKIEEGMNIQYLLKSFNLNNLEEDGTIMLKSIEGLVEVSRGYLSNLVQKDHIDSSVNSDSWLAGGKVFKYNGRINIFNTEEMRDVNRRTYAMLQDIKQEYKCQIMTVWTHEGGDYADIDESRRPMFYYEDVGYMDDRWYPTTDDRCEQEGNDFRHVQATESDMYGRPESETEGTFAAYVLIKETDASYVVKIAEEWGKGYVQGRMPAFICWPNRNATKIIVYRGSNVSCKRYVYPLRKHATADLAYWSEYTDDEVESENTLYGSALYNKKNADYDKAIAKGVTVKRPNYIYTSGADNPFVFDWSGVNRVGSGRIKAVAIQRAAISQGQFGTSPLIVMCTDGNFAMSVSQSKTQTGVEEGLFYAVNPMVSDVLKGEGIAMTEDGILYVSDNGVIMLSGNQSLGLSEALNGAKDAETQTFSEWAQDALPLYDYTNKRVMIVKETLCFIMDLASKAWTTMTLPGEVVSVIQEYPYPMLQVKMSDGAQKVITFDSAYGYKETDTAECSLETRPMRLESMRLKKLNQIAVQADADSEISVTLMGSNDLKNWNTLGTTKNRRVPRIAGRLYKYWKLKMDMTMKASEDVTGVTLDWTEREESIVR